MQTIPIQPIPSQTVKALLSGQNCQINIMCKDQGCFVDVLIDNQPIVSSVIARDVVPIVCREYAGFAGNLIFVDTQGNNDPQYSGLGSRWNLVYLTEAENALI